MSFIKPILFGLAFGITNTIPGVSGATIAVVLCFFDKLIFAISDFFKDWKNNLKFLLLFAFGTAIGIFGFASLLTYLLQTIPLIIKFIFLGMILGSFPLLLERALKERIKIRDIIATIIACAVVVGMLFLRSDSSGNALTTNSFLEMLKLFGIGFVCGVGPIVPGISGSMVLMVLTGVNGYQSIMTAVTKLDLAILIPFGIGVLASVIILAKLIKVCLKKWSQTTYWAITGFVAGSVVAVFPGIDNFSLTFFLALASGILAFVGTFFLSKLENKKVKVI